MDKRKSKGGLKPKPVIAKDSLGNETRYSSGREAARELGIHRSGVTYCLSGQRMTAGGYRFRYAEE